MKISKVIKFISIIFLCLIGLYYIFFAVIANSDLSRDRHILFMDEQLVFDGVRTILHPPGFKKFFPAIFDGGDHRYGRILWNASALFSFIPERLYGSQGQIIATRMVQFAALLSAYFILIFAFITSWPLRVFGLLSLLSLPGTVYYASMPKPEPLQLLFLALFLWQSKKRTFCFGMYWFFLGLAFGAKISVFLLIFYFTILAFMQRLYLKKDIVHEPKNTKPRVALFSFLLGFLISEPVFLLTFRKFDLRYFSSYLHWTFLNTSHGADDSTVTWLAWLKTLFNSYIVNIPWPLLFLTILCIGVLIFIHLIGLIKEIDSLRYINKMFLRYNALIVLTAGLILIIPNIVFVKRIWLFYLHNGSVIFLIGIFSLIEVSIASKEKVYEKLNFIKYISFLLAGLLIIESLFFLTPVAAKEYTRLSKRTQEENFIKQLSEYDYLTDLLIKISNRLGRKVAVFFDPNLFLPYSNEKFDLVRYWGHFISWSEGKDVIIFYKNIPGEVPPPKTSLSYDLHVKSAQLLKEHVISTTGGRCKVSPCYYFYPSKLENISIYIKSDLYGALVDSYREE
ncbi:MAG: hypothetical protein PHC37_05480 [Candidatus Omnitrophica bacterium]|jgi:hypothetical protein|nr:hypothetical protein [Candidatus Omnitrophota bacterium]